MEGVFVTLLQQEGPEDKENEQPGESLPPSPAPQKVVRVNVPFTTREDGVEECWTIVPANEADPSQNRPSEKSVFAQAFLGRKEGDIVQVFGPKGDEYVYKILWVGD